LSFSSSSDVVSTFRAAFDGRVIAPGDAGYDQARTVFMGGFDRYPAVIVRPANSTEVARSITLARQTGLELAVRSGGHSGAGHSSPDGGIVIDVRDMKAIDIDRAGGTAWAETGLTAAEYSRAVAAVGMATGFGDTGSVGIGGITLAGGIGFLTRKYGLTIDSVLGAEVVTADGTALTVDDTSHPDLFWAIRGGGGNFGVVTRFRYRLHPVDRVIGGMLLLPATAEGIARAIEVSDAAPEELSAIVNVMPAPPLPFVPAAVHGQLVMMILLCHAGDGEAGERAVAPLRAIAQPIVDMVRPIRYPEMFPPEDPSYHPKAVSETMFIDRVDRGVGGTILDYLRRSDASLRVAQLRVLGGAMARVPADATAFVHRNGRILVNVAAFYEGAHDKPVRQAWVAELAAALRQAPRGKYAGFVGDEGEAGVRAAYPGSTWDRLAAIKARYDPDNLFRLNQNIPPGH
jgi:FAD/FMN-containing dehydrogenase